ncbi:MAG: DUF5663 domain-containing protein [Candidatus Gribaldobacteria bacterium]|nr:DUF5663 domain-containing protein [Candidatus Gribaldobacteria bacterium]
MDKIIPAEIRAFLEKIIEEKKYQNLNPKLKEDMVLSLFSRLEAFLLTDIAKHLSDKDAKELDRMMENGETSQERVQVFFQEHIKNINEVIAQSMLEFRAIYLNS